LDRASELPLLTVWSAKVRVAVAENRTGFPVVATTGDLEQNETTLQILVRPLVAHQAFAKVSAGRGIPVLTAGFQRPFLIAPTYSAVGVRVSAGDERKTGQNRRKDQVRGHAFLG
jgi:hypothetical protein